MDLRDKVVEKINSNIPPPDSPATLKKKYPKSHTLVDTGNLLNSVVEDGIHTISEGDNNMEVAVGVFDEGVAEYAIANEFGSTRVATTKNVGNKKEMHQGYSTITIPERSFLRSAYDENIEEIMDGLTEEIGEIFARKFKEMKF